MGVVALEICTGLLDENLVDNIDEAHFVVNMDNGRTFSFWGDKHVDVVFIGMGISMMVKVTRGVGRRIDTPFLIFQNDASSYLIHGVSDNILGVCYHTAS